MTLKLGSSVVSTIKLGSNRVSMIKLGTTTIYPPTAPPSGVVLEDFEGTPLVSDYTWTKDLSPIVGGPYTSVVTVTRTTSHVTEGTNSWEFTGTLDSVVNYFGGISTSSTVNLSAYSHLLLDVYLQTIGLGLTFDLWLVDASVNAVVINTNIAGAGTLDLDLVAAGGTVDLTAVYIMIFASIGSGAGGVFDCYADNLRVT